MQRPCARPFLFLNSLGRWRLALLLVFFTGGGGIGWSVWREQHDLFIKADERHAKAKQDLEKTRQEWDRQKGEMQKDIRVIHKQIDNLFSDWQQQENNKRTAAEQQRVQLFVNGPQVAQAGAPNKYEVQLVQQDKAIMNNFAQQPGFQGKDQGQQGGLPGVPLNVRAVNQTTNQTLYQNSLVTQQDGKAEFSLPSDMPIKPGEDIVLEFDAPMANGKKIKLRDNLKLVFLEYVTHLTTDRPLYRPGDTVRFRSLTLERFSLKPAQQPFHLRYRIVGPNNAKPIFESESRRPARGTARTTQTSR